MGTSKDATGDGAVRGSRSFSGALDNSSFGSCSSFLAHDTDEATSASSWVARDADDATSESSWAALAKERKETGGALTSKVTWRSRRSRRSQADPWIPQGKMGHWSARTKITKEESEELKEAGNEKQNKEMEVDEAAPQEVSAEIQSPKRKVIRAEIRRTARLRAGNSGRKKQRKWASSRQ